MPWLAYKSFGHKTQHLDRWRWHGGVDKDMGKDMARQMGVGMIMVVGMWRSCSYRHGT